MSQYKVKKDHLGWFGQTSTHSDEHSAAVVEDLNRKLTERRVYHNTDSFHSLEFPVCEQD